MSDSPVDVHGATWQPVSARLRTARILILALMMVPVAVVAVLSVVATSPWMWVAPAIVALVVAWSVWIIIRQVKALGYAELPEELAVRRGIMFQRLILVPYGRMQYIEVDSGPLARRLKIATVTLHTAAVSQAKIPGLPADEARRLRDRLTLRSDSMLAGI